MKKLFFVVVLLIAMALTSYGKTADKNKMAMKELYIAVKPIQGSGTVSQDAFKLTSINANGSSIVAFYDIDTDELIGFAIPIATSDLPATALYTMKTKYGRDAAQEAMMFVNKDGCFGFYVSLVKPKKGLCGKCDCEKKN